MTRPRPYLPPLPIFDSADDDFVELLILKHRPGNAHRDCSGQVAHGNFGRGLPARNQRAISRRDLVIPATRAG
jgi:hypothetical protein